jgi:multicomponent K+:H+ antiporter subunit E
MSFVSRLVPAPLLSLALAVLWLVLARTTSLGQLLLALALGLIVPFLTVGLRQSSTRVRRPLVVLRYILTVGYDVIASSLQVARGVIVSGKRPPCAAFVLIPLELREPVGLAALAMVTTVVPGTVWSELALDRSALLLHVWSVDDVPAFVARFKARYEAPLREIFE